MPREGTCHDAGRRATGRCGAQPGLGHTGSPPPTPMRRHASAPRSDVSKNLKMSLALVFAALIAVLVAANAGGGDDGPEVVAEDGGAPVVRPDRQRLSTSASDVTLDRTSSLVGTNWYGS